MMLQDVAETPDIDDADFPVEDGGRPSCLGPSRYWRLHENMNGYVVEPIPHRALTACSVAAVVTLATLPTVYFLELPWPIAVLGVIAGGIAMAIMYMLIKGEIDRGPYLVHRADRDEIDLPRYGVRVPQSAVERLVIRFRPHRTTDGPRKTAELILTIRDGEIPRNLMLLLSLHHSDIRKLAEDLASRLNVPRRELQTQTAT